MSASEQTLKLLTEIRDGIRDGNELLSQLLAGGGASGGTGAVASDADLDSKHGNPQIRMRVRDWSGPDFKGKKASQCPAEFLDLYAETLEWAAGKDMSSGDADKKKYAPLKRKDAARCRGWAKRIRDGKVPATAAAAQRRDDGDDWGGDSTGGGW